MEAERTMEFLDRWSAGFGRAFSGVRLITGNGKLLALAAVPVLINTLVFVGGFWLLWSYRTDVVESVWTYPQSGWFWQGLWYVLSVLIFLLAGLAAYFLFTPIGCLIAGPFNDFLSAGTERALNPNIFVKEASFSLKTLWILVKKELAKLLAAGLVIGFGLLLNLIPVAGQFLWGAFMLFAGGWLLCLQYLDYPMSRYGYDFGEIRRTIADNYWYCLGFGAGAGVLLLIPFLNLAAIPVCVVSATGLYVDLRDGPDGLPAPRVTEPTQNPPGERP